MKFDIYKSNIDASVNFTHKCGDGQALEARYVRRHSDYLACYLSSQTGCAQACRFCHLTFTGQNQAREATAEEILFQAKQVLEYFKSLKEEPKAKVVHYNFMARGEPLDSRLITGFDTGEKLLGDLGKLALSNGLMPRFLISTIMPMSLAVRSDFQYLEHRFPIIQPEFYYSLYSMDPEFRRRWLPRAMPPDTALELLTHWQRHTKKIVRIHYAIIKGENDRLEDAHSIVEALKKHGLRADFSLVRYNPPSPRHGEEADNYEAYAEFLRQSLDGVRVKTIDRVGPDVAASCGMFLNVKD